MEPRVAERDCRALADSPNHFAVLGIEWDASDAQVRAAYLSKVKQFHPDRVSPEVRDYAQHALTRIVDAWKALRDNYARAAYWERLSDERARAAYWESVVVPPPVPDAWEILDRARAYVRAGEFWSAVQLMESVVDRLRGAEKSQAIYLLAFSYSKNPNWQGRAVELLEGLLRGEPGHSEARGLLKRLRRGDEGDASESEVVR